MNKRYTVSNKKKNVVCNKYLFNVMDAHIKGTVIVVIMKIIVTCLKTSHILLLLPIDVLDPTKSILRSVLSFVLQD